MIEFVESTLRNRLPLARKTEATSFQYIARKFMHRVDSGLIGFMANT